MTNDLDLYGVFVPSLFAWVMIAYIAGLPLRRILAWSGFYRFVWHRPLFDVALFVVLVGIVVLITVVLR
jgi:hypothetical protein